MELNDHWLKVGGFDGGLKVRLRLKPLENGLADSQLQAEHVAETLPLRNALLDIANRRGPDLHRPGT